MGTVTLMMNYVCALLVLSKSKQGPDWLNVCEMFYRVREDFYRIYTQSSVSLVSLVCLSVCVCGGGGCREKFFQEVNSLQQKTGGPLAKTRSLVKSLMNRTELLLHVTIAPHSRSLAGTPSGTPGNPPPMGRNGGHSVSLQSVCSTCGSLHMILKSY